MCFGMADRTELFMESLEMENEREAVVLTDAFESNGAPAPMVVAAEVADDEVRVDMAGSSLGGTGGTASSEAGGSVQPPSALRVLSGMTSS